MKPKKDLFTGRRKSLLIDFEILLNSSLNDVNSELNNDVYVNQLKVNIHIYFNVHICSMYAKMYMF